MPRFRQVAARWTQTATAACFPNRCPEILVPKKQEGPKVLNHSWAMPHIVCSVTTGVIPSGMSSMYRVRVSWQRFNWPWQCGHKASRCSRRWSMRCGGGRRQPLWPFCRPASFATWLWSAFDRRESWRMAWSAARRPNLPRPVVWPVLSAPRPPLLPLPIDFPGLVLGQRWTKHFVQNHVRACSAHTYLYARTPPKRSHITSFGWFVTKLFIAHDQLCFTPATTTGAHFF